MAHSNMLGFCKLWIGNIQDLIKGHKNILKRRKLKMRDRDRDGERKRGGGGREREREREREGGGREMIKRGGVL